MQKLHLWEHPIDVRTLATFGNKVGIRVPFSAAVHAKK
jgi:hypothetical protein